MGSGQDGKHMGHQGTSGYKPTGQSVEPDQSDLSAQLQGKNSLAGNDQERTRNQRRRVPDETTQTEGVVESFELQDAAKRAQRTK
jgi:hypothetical protein